MTVSSTTSKASYTGDGSTATFVVPFYFLADGDLLVVTKTSGGAVTTLALTTDYTVTGAGVSSGGSITLVNGALTVGTTITIARNATLTQLVDYQANDPFPAETHERALDRLTMIAQQLYEGFQRALRVPITTTTIDGEIPTPIANRALKWSEDGTYLVNSDIDPDDLYTTSLTNANSAAVSAANAALSAASAQTVYNQFNALYMGPMASDPVGTYAAGTTYYNTGSQRWRVYTGSNWADAATSAAASYTPMTFNGDNTTTTFTLTATPSTSASVIVFISGVAQRPTTDYTVSGTSLIFTSAPPTGTANIYVIVANSIATGTPDNNSVSTAKIQDLAVTAAKMAVGAAIANIGYTPMRGSNNLSELTSASAARTNLGLLPAAITPIGTAAGNLVALDGSARLPAVDGSLLTGLATGGMTLLGTLNTTSGSTQTLSGLTLTSYKQLFISFNNVSYTYGATSPGTVYVNMSVAGTSFVNVLRTGSPNTMYSFWGLCFVDLSNGVYSSFYCHLTNTTGVTYNGNLGGYAAGKSNISTAATSIRFDADGGTITTTFDSGTITIYGVK